MKKILFTLILISAFVATTYLASAQDEQSTSEPATSEPTTEEKIDNLKGKVDGIDETVQTLNSDVASLKKLKFSGYIQARYEIHQDSKDGLSYKKDKSVNKQLNLDNLYVRRGRLKVQYTGSYSNYVLQLDAAKDKVSLKDAYIELIEPWSGLNAYLTAGQFKWNFGDMVVQSSGVREFPERVQVTRKLFPDERDRGLKLTLPIPREKLQFASAKAEVGVFNGTGTADNIFTWQDNDKNKDIILRGILSLGWLDGGLSLYQGKNTVSTFNAADSTSGLYRSLTTTDKKRMGVDAQFYYDVPSVGGIAFKGEYITGEDSKIKEMGYYAQAVQNIGSKYALMGRYDVWDPNTDKDGDKISTLAVGGIYYYDGNSKFTITHDMPKLEKNDPKDNFWTFQFQFTF